MTVSVRAEPLTVAGDAVLLDRLVHNLVANGIRHNRAGGHVSLRTGPEGIVVSNTGPVVPEDTVPCSSSRSAASRNAATPQGGRGPRPVDRRLHRPRPRRVGDRHGEPGPGGRPDGPGGLPLVPEVAFR